MENTTQSLSRSDEKKKQIQKKEEFENIVKSYLEDKSPGSSRLTRELEVRFGTNPRVSKPITKIDYDNVVKQLYACGFTPEIEEGLQLLRIQSEYIDNRTGQTKMSNVRAEIAGSDLIQEYCRTNSIQRVLDMPSTIFNKIHFTQKMSARDEKNERINHVDMEDFNFRVSYQTEQDFNVMSSLSRNMISKWSDTKKTFRNLNRVRFRHPTYPIFADISIIRSSKKMNRVPIPQYTIQDADVFNNIEQYEVELEVDNARIGPYSQYSTPELLMNDLRKCIRIVLSGIQNSKYPVSYSEQTNIKNEYMTLLHGEKYTPRRIYPKDFVGPSSFTLQIDNIMELTEDTRVINIRNNYTVTEKADGERKLLYISNDGKIYLIDTNMSVIFTGSKTSEKKLYNSLLDGEHINSNKHGNYMQLYGAFDIYYINSKSVRSFKFKDTTDTEELPEVNEKTQTQNEPEKYRLDLLNECVKLLKPENIIKSDNIVDSLIVKTKTFYSDKEFGSIFASCSKKLSDEADNMYEYETDGLIFTPCDLPVGGNTVNGEPGPLYKNTWNHSFKWKPPKFNTIDFLVSVKKNNKGVDELHTVFQEGSNNTSTNVKQYKTIILRCGFDERKHGYINPCQDILNDNIPTINDIDNEETYKPVPFQPTNPYDAEAYLCNIMLHNSGSKQYMMTEENEYFEQDTIVEFKYVMENKEGWKWVPLRVRYDKTAELRAGLKNYGNAYHVANSNWQSIHNPITEQMISTGEQIPEYQKSEEVYYKQSNEETSTQGLRDFHNLFVKRKLIMGVSNRGDTLIDYAVGKGGDLSKWIQSKLKFVFGIDVSPDNIHNQTDGACARYLRTSKKYERIPKALFVIGDSSRNIRNGIAIESEKDKQITNAVFGIGPKDVGMLGKGVYNQYGIAERGFNVSSCQFAIHYFFENKTTFHNFIQNVSECTKIGGYFVGTTYDGKTVFDLLQSKIRGEGITIMKNDKKIYEIQKMYDQTGFPAEESSLNYGIKVYQESINQYFQEYLVNFEYMTRIMEDYGFVLANEEEAKTFGFIRGSGLFSELYSNMEEEVKQNPRRARDYGTAMNMTIEEKRISFMNRYFIFKKVRSVNVEKITNLVTKIDETENIIETEPEALESPVVVKKSRKKKVILKKK